MGGKIMRVGNTELLYYIDYIAKKVHLLDLDEVGRTSLTNAIDIHFQKEFIEQESLLIDLLDFDWICYATDGIVAIYRDYNFKFLNPKLPYLYKEYLEVMKKRRKE
jgi:hypothetical protein